MKIVLFDGSLRTTTFINRLAKGLAKKHEVHIVGFEKPLKTRVPGVSYTSLGSSQSVLHLLWISFKISLKAVFTKGKIRAFFKVLKAIFLHQTGALKRHNFSAVLSDIQPDILHIQWPSLLPWCEEVLENNKVKVILSQRGYQNNVRPFVDEANFEYLQRIYPKLDGFHSVSKGMSQTGDLIFSDPLKIDRVVYSGFELDALAFSDDYTRNTRLELLSIGRPHWIKGYSDAFRACDLLKQKGVNFTYRIIGAQDNEELQYLQNELGLNEQIRLLPKVSQAKVYELMREAEVLLFPSIKEGLPNVVVEAMAVGLPVVATNCGGVEELLSDSCGSVVPVRDAEAMSKALIAFSEMDTTTLMEQRKKARLKVEAQHRVTTMVENMEALYTKCLQSTSD